MDDAHSKSVDEVLGYFGTDPDKGLSPDQIKRNQEKYGPNGKFLFLFNSDFSEVSCKLAKTVRADIRIFLK